MTTTTTDLSTATAALNAAWNPPPAGRLADVDEHGFWDNGCGCGGTDDEGEPLCSCREGCGCVNCEHSDHVRARHCAVPGCTDPSRVQIRAWSVSHHQVQAKQLDPELTPETGGDEWVELDDTPSYGWSKPACSHRHARQLVDDDRASDWRQRAEASKDPDRRLRYEIRPWRYEPDRLDVGELLANLRDTGRVVALATAELARAGYDPADPRVLPADVSLDDARRAVARLADMLAAISTHAPEPRRFSAGDPEPAGLHTVRQGDDYYHRGAVGDPTVWVGPTVAQRYNWDQLTALGDVTELPRPEVVTPTEAITS